MAPNPSILQLQGLLQAIYAAVPGVSAVIAGGAPRDVLNGRPVKDIDVFLHHADGVAYYEGCCRFAEQLHVKLGDLDGDELAEAYDGGTDIIEVQTLSTCQLNLPIQLIRLEGDPIDHISTFDFGLCQVFTTRNRAHWKPAYLKDYANQTITYVETEPDSRKLRRSAKHLKRIMVKYPGWGLRGCGMLTEYMGL